jgi:uncharacterized protein YndB with AHSA1/START domain
LVRIEKAIDISAPPERVWELLTLDRLEEWLVSPRMQLPIRGMAFISEVRVPEDKYRVGATAQPKMEKEDVLWKVMESRKNEKIVYLVEEQREKGITVTYTVVLEPVEEGTKFTYAGELDMPWGVVGKLIQPFAKRMGEREIEMSLKKLKSILET